MNVEMNFNDLDLNAEGENHAIKPSKDGDIVEFTKNYKAKLRAMPEVEALTSRINVEDPTSILMFGKEAAEGISKVSDGLLSTMRTVNAEEAGEMIKQLTKIMDKFDIKELQDIKEPSMIQKFFKKAQNSVELMFQKYQTMGSEVDKVYITLKKYEQDIEQSNKNLKLMYNTNIDYYKELEKFIVAGELAIEELNNELIPEYQRIADESGDQLDISNIQTLRKVLEMMEQRVYDLKIAENVALQTIPMIQGIQYSNFNLTRKINSAFIITLPIFKQCLTQAIMLKRQELQAKSLKALDDKTNELLLRNAENLANQTVNITRMTGSGSVSMETLEKTWSTIMRGIEETKLIQEQNKAERANNSQRLEQIKYEMAKKQKNY
ncbi:toxic anion resistance protein [uncultured Clostridium sp.]|uniref:toxic anion resistance protein n=1 Tax=uncultured Clostridium sp. TaxID=59620 RepID=UPI0028EE07C8|nr:toxic anion resistance protein [uncultured Clostridium sp.]